MTKLYKLQIINSSNDIEPQVQFFSKISVDGTQNFEFFKLCEGLLVVKKARDCEPFVLELEGVFFVVYEAKSFSDAFFAILDNQNPPTLLNFSGF